MCAVESIDTVQIQRIGLEQVRPLRHEVLRPGLPFDTTLWDHDEAPDTAHFGVVKNGEVLSIGTVFKEAYPGHPDAVRLRGMATAPAFRKKGYGNLILDAVVEYARTEYNSDLIWCNAREAAFGFYKRYGFELVGERFEIPIAGWHKVGLYYL